MQPSEVCDALIRSFETRVLQSYPDPESPLAKAIASPKDDRPAQWWRLPGDPWTIGWGATGPDVTKGTTWTKDQCDARLASDITRFGIWVEKLVHVPLTQNQFDALTSLTMNIGAAAFAGSTMHRLLQQARFAEASAEFPRWRYARGQVVDGLVRRRLAERLLFDDPVIHPSPTTPAT